MTSRQVILSLLLLLVLMLVIIAAVSLLVDWLFPFPQYEAPGVTATVIEQGEQTNVPAPDPPANQIIQPAQANIEVQTEVTQRPLSLLSQYPSLTLPDMPGIQPNQAVVVREVYEQGNTTITVLTPVVPVGEVLASSSNDVDTQGDDQLDPGQIWYIAETVVTISRERSRLKPVAGISFDGDKEDGIAYELAQLKDRPPWLPERLYNLVGYSSIDLLATLYRIGVGASLEVYTSDLLCVDLGAAGTLQFRPKLEPEIFIYGSVHF